MIAKQPFGRTGHLSTRLIFGAAAFGSVTQQEADQTMELLLRYGINHIDTAASYGDSEIRLGPWMAKYRQRFFLATKTGERTYEKARAEIHRSLERLQTDHVDLIQLHSLTDPDEWNVAMGPGGALEAAIEARQQGLVRFIGVTGHGLTVARMHKKALERFDFDSVLLPYNYPLMQNPQYAAEFEELVALCKERNVAIQTIKSLARGPYDAFGGQRTHATWYKPLENQAAIDRAVAFVLSRPELFLNTTGDIHILPMLLDAADRFTGQAPTPEAMQEIVAAEQMAPLFA
jgi:aryl-alcohol dehydrogenase-like predicted oxidoreductase